MYTSFSLSGTWEMDYAKDAYLDTKVPVVKWEPVKNAVPGYWEDMTDSFLMAPFFCKLEINPLYGLQQYPISGVVPDMALPNIVGNFFYRRTFCCENIVGDACLHFEGVQNAVSVWINGTYLGRHEGYSAPFAVQIPEGLLVDGENEVILSISNHRLMGYGGEPVSGLTSRAANECTGGITGELTLRVYTGPLRDAAVLISEDCKTASVQITAVSEAEYTWSVWDGETELKTGKANGDFSFSTEGLEFWSPESPKLYTLRIECEGSLLLRQFGVRKLTVDGTDFRLNGVPYYLRGICEHCYFPETVHPDHNISYYREMIKTFKKLGFNFIRFHTFIPAEEYMQAADELGMLLHVETPNNTSEAEWKEIVTFCRRHTSVVIYCGGNELWVDEDYIEHFRKCAADVHARTDAFFTPMNAIRGLEYAFPKESALDPDMKTEPFLHHPGRFKLVDEFTDMYASYPLGQLSYNSLTADPKKVDNWSVVYNKPRVTHEICIDGTYADLSLKDRYRGWKIGKTDMFSSIERHLEEKGVLHKAPLYFKNSSEWQRRIRKHCFEAVRRCHKLGGYDFLGPIDTHWHTFGYDVGMMNEFYELKPGETVRNVRMYNSPTVLLTDLDRRSNFTEGEVLETGIHASYFGERDLIGGILTIRLSLSGKVIYRKEVEVDRLPNGKISKLYDLQFTLPEVKKPADMKLYVTLDGDGLFTENEWELYLFPKVEMPSYGDLLVSDGMTDKELFDALEQGKDVLIFGAEPFVSRDTSFRISLAGRTSGYLATVIADHPVMRDIPHEGFCGWQFAELLTGGKSVCFDDSVPFNPIVEVAPTHKCVVRQASLFEYRALSGRLLVCGFRFDENDPMAQYLRARLIEYAKSDAFCPADAIDRAGLAALLSDTYTKTAENTNFAMNQNDITATRRNKK